MSEASMPSIPTLADDPTLHNLGPLSRRMEKRLGGYGPERITVDSPDFYGVEEIERRYEVQLSVRLRRLGAALMAAVPSFVGWLWSCRFGCGRLVYIAALAPRTFLPKRRDIAYHLAWNLAPEHQRSRIAMLYWYARLQRSSIARRKRRSWREESA